MLILHIDASSSLCSVALARGGEELGFEINSEPLSHGTDINLMIDKLIRRAGTTMRGLDAVSVNRGPGSFTALRIGMATAKGICFALDLPLLTPDGMQILVDWAGRVYPGYDYYVPMIDARRMEVYTIDPVKSLDEVFHYKAQILDVGSFGEIKNKKVCFLGDGVSKWKEILPDVENWKMVSVDLDARKMIEISYKFSIQNNFSELFHAIPLYIKKPNITRSKKQYF